MSDYEQEIAGFWQQVFLAYTESSNSTSADQGAIWADAALVHYRSRFPEPNPPPPPKIGFGISFVVPTAKMKRGI
jgi:hypothetical protein